MPLTFKQKVYAITKKIPKGKVATYKQIAKLAGSPLAVRAVGSCMKTNPFAPIVPCHRVVGSSGDLVGYSGKGGIAGKRAMLLKEGVKLIHNKVDLKTSLWKKH